MDRSENQRPHHRRWWLIVSAVVLAVVAIVVGGAVVWWNGRGPSKPSIGEAVDRFRSSSTAPGTTAAMHPEPGVYTYAGSGTEHLSFLATSQSQDGSLPGSVTMGTGSCWTFAIEYNSFHHETWDRCSRDGRLVERGNTTDQKFDFGALSQSEHTEVVCDPPTTLYNPTARPGARTPVRCTGHSQTTNADMTQRGVITFVGRTTLLVGTTRVPVLHYVQTLKITGGQAGTQREEVWLAADTWLPVREERKITVVSPAPAPINHVTYTEKGSWRLVSLTPRT